MILIIEATIFFYIKLKKYGIVEVTNISEMRRYGEGRARAIVIKYKYIYLKFLKESSATFFL